MSTLREILNQQVREGDLYEKLDRNRVRCYACGHCCPIPDGQPGVCKVRYNQGGTLYVPWGYVGGVQCDPIEKKPFFHAYPGALAYSFGMLGCDLHCAYCQNWVTSQALRDPNAVSPPLQASPEALVQDALRQGAKVLVSTYNEPLITSEWAVAVFKEAKAAGLITGFVSNGNGTPQVLEYLRPWVDLYKVDLKSFDDRHYHELGGRIGPILDTIRSLHQMGLWLEIVTLLIPGFNDSAEELHRLTEFIAGVSADIPWHVTAFHKDYKMDDPENTRPEDLVARRGDWEEIRPPLHLRWKSARTGGRVGKHPLPPLWRNGDSARRVFDSQLSRHSGRTVPELRRMPPGPLGQQIRRPDRGLTFLTSSPPAFGYNPQLAKPLHAKDAHRHASVPALSFAGMFAARLSHAHAGIRSDREFRRFQGNATVLAAHRACFQQRLRFTPIFSVAAAWMDQCFKYGMPAADCAAALLGCGPDAVGSRNLPRPDSR